MKRLIFLIAILWAHLSHGQTSNLPSSMGTFTVFKEAPLPVTIVMPPGYNIVAPQVEVWNNNVKLSDTTQVSVSGDTLKFTLTKRQLAPLNRNPYFFVKLDSAYVLGALLNPTIGVGNPTAQTKTVTLPSTGIVRVSVLGSASEAIASATIAKAAEVSAVLAKQLAEGARDAALIQAGVYATEAEGRAAVANGQAFKVQGSGDVAAYEYRRTNSTTSVLIASYPSVQAALTDPKNSPNLITFSNQNAENWGLSSVSPSTAPKVYRQSGTVTLTFEKNQKNLGFWVKGVMEPSSRYNFIGNDIPLEALPVGTKVMVGYYMYLKPGTVLDATNRATIYRNTGGGENTLTTENIDLGGGLYYVRTTTAFTIPSYTGTLQLRAYLITASSSPSGSEVWIGSPALIRTEKVLSPQSYLGADYVNFGKIESFVSEKLNINGLLDVGFRKQAVGATSLIAPWSTTSAATSTTFAASYIIETVPDGPIGSKAIKVTHFKNSADSKSSDFQLTQRVAIPATFVGADKISFGFWMKRSSLNISFIDSPIIFYDAVAGGTPTTLSIPPSYISSSVSEWTYVRYENISVPANSHSVSVRIRSQCLSSAPTNVNYYLWMQAPQLSFGSPTANAINLGVADDAALAVETGLASAFDLPVLPNGNFANGLVSHSFLTGATFLPEYVLFDTLTPIGTKAVKVSNTKRVSDNALSILRDYIEISVVAGEKTSISFSFLWKGDPTYINAFTQIEFRTASASVSTSTGTFTSRQDLSDGWYRIYASGVSIPATATVIRCSARMEAKSAATAGSLYTSYHVGHMAAFGNSVPIFSTTKYTEISTKLVNDASFTTGLSEKVNPVNKYGLEGKKVGFFGNSIIAANVNTTGVIQPNREVDLLVKKFGIIPYVRGVGGTRVVDNGSTAWFAADGLYLNRPIAQGGTTDTPPAGSVGGLIPSALSTAERIATIPTDTEILYVRVGTNDYINYPVGNIYSTHDQTTFAGAYMLMLDRIYARIPNAIIILSTPTHRDGEDTAIGTGLADGVRFEQVREVIRAIAKKEKLRLCDMSNTGINQRNHTVYLSDGIHPNNAGYNLMYRTEAETFKSIYP